MDQAVTAVGARRQAPTVRTVLAVRVAVRRLTLLAPMVLLVSAAVFALGFASPFDPLQAYLGREHSFTAEQQSQIASELGLAGSWPQLWWRWLIGVLHGDLGTSLSYSRSVGEVIAGRLPWTLVLGAGGALIAGALALSLGLRAALTPRGRLARTITAVATVLQAIPPFALAMASILLFALTLHWLPSGGLTTAGNPVTAISTVQHLALPALALGLSQAPWLLLSFRQSVLTVSDSPAVLAALSRGIPARRIALRHILPAAAGPMLALMGARLPELLVGSTVVESIFGWPGIGQALVRAAQDLDFSLLVAITVLLTGIVMLGNLAADVAQILIDPRTEADG